MAQHESSSMPTWAAFDKDEDPTARRRASPTAVVVVAVLLAAGVVAGAALWPRPVATRAAASPSQEAPTAPPTATGTPAPTLSTAASTQAPGTDGTQEPATPSPATPTTGSPSPPAPAPSPVLAATATAPATSPASVDGAGRRVTYAASNMLDGDPSTAWRVRGALTGKVLTFSLGGPRELSEVGLVNGYAKVDPATLADRYAQARRITRVTWTVGGQQVVQDLADSDRSVQTVTFPPVTAQTVTLRIDAVTAPGNASFDQTAISEVVLADG